MESHTSPRVGLPLEVHPEVAEALEGILGRIGMPKRRFLERLLSWFAQQEPTIQHAILGSLPQDAAPDLARLLLSRMGAERGRVDKPYAGEAPRGGGRKAR